MAGIYAAWQCTCVNSRSDVPVWILVIGGVGLVLGLATYGVWQSGTGCCKRLGWLLRHGSLPALLLSYATRMCWPVLTGLPGSFLVFAGYKIIRVLGKAGGLVARVAQHETCAFVHSG